MPKTIKNSSKYSPRTQNNLNEESINLTLSSISSSGSIDSSLLNNSRSPLTFPHYVNRMKPEDSSKIKWRKSLIKKRNSMVPPTFSSTPRRKSVQNGFKSDFSLSPISVKSSCPNRLSKSLFVDSNYKKRRKSGNNTISEFCFKNSNVSEQINEIFNKYQDTVNPINKESFENNKKVETITGNKVNSEAKLPKNISTQFPSVKTAVKANSKNVSNSYNDSVNFKHPKKKSKYATEAGKVKLKNIKRCAELKNLQKFLILLADEFQKKKCFKKNENKIEMRSRFSSKLLSLDNKNTYASPRKSKAFLPICHKRTYDNLKSNKIIKDFDTDSENDVSYVGKSKKSITKDVEPSSQSSIGLFKSLKEHSSTPSFREINKSKKDLNVTNNKKEIKNGKIKKSLTKSNKDFEMQGTTSNSLLQLPLEQETFSNHTNKNEGVKKGRSEKSTTKNVEDYMQETNSKSNSLSLRNNQEIEQLPDSNDQHKSELENNQMISLKQNQELKLDPIIENTEVKNGRKKKSVTVHTPTQLQLPIELGNCPSSTKNDTKGKKRKKKKSLPKNNGDFEIQENTSKTNSLSRHNIQKIEKLHDSITVETENHSFLIPSSSKNEIKKKRGRKPKKNKSFELKKPIAKSNKENKKQSIILPENNVRKSTRVRKQTTIYYTSVLPISSKRILKAYNHCAIDSKWLGSKNVVYKMNTTNQFVNYSNISTQSNVSKEPNQENLRVEQVESIQNETSNNSETRGYITQVKNGKAIKLNCFSKFKYIPTKNEVNSQAILNNSGNVIGTLVLKGNQCKDWNILHTSNICFQVLEGSVEFYLEDNKFVGEKFDYFYVNIGIRYKIVNPSDSQILRLSYIKI